MSASQPASPRAHQRIVSFLPAATEMVFALGLEDLLMGVTHECDYPPEAARKPIVVRGVLPLEGMSHRDIDAAVAARMQSGQSLYRVDEALMREIAPDLILTQDLCQVCAPSGNEVADVLKSLPVKPDILWLTPTTIDGVFDNLRELGAATGTSDRAEELITTSRERLDAIEAKTRALASRPKVFCMEWMDPVYCSGHWVPEMVRIAGGDDLLGRAGGDSERIAWDAVVRSAPDVIVVMPCGYHLDQAIEQARQLFDYPGARDLPAVREGRVYAVDASSYFARPGPRVIDGTQLLAHLIHPELSDWHGPADAFRMLDSAPRALVEGEDYYLEGDAFVFTASYLLRRGYCCGSGCRHCPYRKAT